VSLEVAGRTDHPTSDVGLQGSRGHSGYLYNIHTYIHGRRSTERKSRWASAKRGCIELVGIKWGECNGRWLKI
jgi:hypothetical protein